MTALQQLQLVVKKSAMDMIIPNMREVQVDSIVVEAFIDGFLYNISYEDLQRTYAMDVSDAFYNTYMEPGVCGHLNH